MAHHNFNQWPWLRTTPKTDNEAREERKTNQHLSSRNTIRGPSKIRNAAKSGQKTRRQTQTPRRRAYTETSFWLRASHKNKTQKNSQISTYHREKDAKSTQRKTARRNIQLFTSIQTTTRQTEAMDHKATLKQSNGGALCGSR